MSVPPLSTDRIFYPFTQPILYGKVEYFIKHGSNDDQHYVDGHERISSDLLVITQPKLRRCFVAIFHKGEKRAILCVFLLKW